MKRTAVEVSEHLVSLQSKYREKLAHDVQAFVVDAKTFRCVLFQMSVCALLPGIWHVNRMLCHAGLIGR